MSAAFASRRARTRPRAPNAAMNCVPLTSERPSFAWSRCGSSPARSSASPPGSRSPPNHASPSPTSGSARCASGARSPLAPTEPRDGTTGSTPRSRHSSSSSTSSGRAPERPFASAFARSSIAARTISSGIRLAHPARVAAQETELELLGQLLRDRLRDEPAEAGVDAVGVLARAVRRAVDDRARRVHLARAPSRRAPWARPRRRSPRRPRRPGPRR